MSSVRLLERNQKTESPDWKGSKAILSIFYKHSHPVLHSSFEIWMKAYKSTLIYAVGSVCAASPVGQGHGLTSAINSNNRFDLKQSGTSGDSLVCRTPLLPVELKVKKKKNEYRNPMGMSARTNLI